MMTHHAHYHCTAPTPKLVFADDKIPISDEELNLNDPTYYPPPMTPELRREWIRLQSQQRKYQMHKAFKIDDVQRREKVRPVIIEALQTQTIPETAHAEADRMFRTFDRARNTLMWSYALTYFLSGEDLRRAKLEMAQSNLEMRLEQVASIIFHYNHEPFSTIQHATNKLEECTRCLLEDAES
jgi:hypothetical protein